MVSAVAQTIYEQLGGNKFATMVGAKDILGDEQGLYFKIGRNSGGVNYVRIRLQDNDTYIMEFLNYGKKRRTKEEIACGIPAKDEIKLVKLYTDVYFDQLQELFTTVTGMYTSL